MPTLILGPVLRLKGLNFIFLIGLGLKRELAYVAASPRTEQTLICLGCSCIFKCVVSSGVDKTNNKSVLAHMGWGSKNVRSTPWKKGAHTRKIFIK